MYVIILILYTDVKSQHIAEKCLQVSLPYREKLTVTGTVRFELEILPFFSIPKICMTKYKWAFPISYSCVSSNANSLLSLLGSRERVPELPLIVLLPCSGRRQQSLVS